MKLSFHGGAREVTGACYLFETAKTKILVDCGLFQGCDEYADMNFADFKFNPREIDALFVTHAHIDHVGRIPKLVREGFSGKIYSTPPTRDIAALLLEDALSLAKREERELFTQNDLGKTLSLWEEVPYHTDIEVGDMRARLDEAGHILGSALVEIRAEGKHLLFSGDLGNAPSEFLPEPDRVRGVEYLVVESTYGNREHESAEERVQSLERAVEDVTARRGTLLIPAFATERTQDVLFLLNRMLFEKRIPEIPVFVDSPLAIRVTNVFEKYPLYYKKEIQSLFKDYPYLFKFKKLRMTETVEESKAINDVPPPKVVIAGSGMMQGGRILHHLRRHLSDSNSILLVVGYQAAGSLGRRLIDRAKIVKIFREEVPVWAEVRKINGFSAHADNPQLFSFVSSNRDTLKKVFVVQGEEAQALHLMQEVKDQLGIYAEAPVLYDTFEI
ncbi:MAG: hypothetical protein A3C07_03965 [Candidatus Sungbacteria bacterium RIFCSPHIGHO2_02_FULL_47_11]|uniref:MBL fold hydrolase n=1 Tax=Candidatus Sungbacteria bacterium RIFCSPHIGHO2_02_FULL_47_11 TaxID=1802270 RepID=A0A1G2KGL7_9BACT|nr:MAG: hypothetical protein A3C07_03965 [Candidatus Sungbacteria bacterium RIFCSPHIGHO2_02_FULL_47_11]